MTAMQTTSLLALILYLAAFFAGSRLAERAVGQSVWLFGTARGWDRVAAIGFRASFALALIGPLVWAAVPGLAARDPLWAANLNWLALPGTVAAMAGAGLAFASQIAMGASWRVGVRADTVGELVSAGLYTVSRNPTFLGQAVLLGGVALAVPSMPGVVAVVLFISAAQMQIRSEEALLRQAHGDMFDAYAARVPRWVGRPGRRD